mmetsp:Transcript_16757/g.33354  ORF Transcript_16757/g.33354 Transcript_16757/m.33354 type:complete len:84 (+) Transcript_16757:320-571(+)
MHPCGERFDRAVRNGAGTSSGDIDTAASHCGTGGTSHRPHTVCQRPSGWSGCQEARLDRCEIVVAVEPADGHECSTHKRRSSF